MGKVILNITIFADQVCVRVCVCVYVRDKEIYESMMEHEKSLQLTDLRTNMGSFRGC